MRNSPRPQKRSIMLEEMRRAFTLIELLVVIAILAVLAAFLFPVFARAKDESKKTGCLSNLSQIGKGMLLYMADHDDVFPQAIDASDKFAPAIWGGSPEWQARLASMPLMHEVLQPYVKSKELFRCPADVGNRILDNHFPVELPAAPSMFATYGSSYFFRTEIAFRGMSGTSFQLPADVNVMFDGAGHWHGAARRLEPTDTFGQVVELRRQYRYNTLFGDMRVKSLTRDQLQEAWRVDL
jgi:prepilin-type N-terminal cleavage/methylation domain-containing protein